MIYNVYLFTRERLIGASLKRALQFTLKPPVSILKVMSRQLSRRNIIKEGIFLTVSENFEEHGFEKFLCSSL